MGSRSGDGYAARVDARIRNASTVARWVRSLARGDLAGALACVDDDVQLVEPGATVDGVEELRAWIVASSETVQPLRWFANDEVVLVEQLVTQVPRDPDVLVFRPSRREAIAFELRDDTIVRIERHQRVDEARAALGLDDAYELEEPLP